MLRTVSIGTSIVLIAVGAILYYATNFDIEGIEIDTVGLILMIVGIVGLLISLFMYANATRRGAVVERDRYVDRDPRY